MKKTYEYLNFASYRTNPCIILGKNVILRNVDITTSKQNIIRIGDGCIIQSSELNANEGNILIAPQCKMTSTKLRSTHGGNIEIGNSCDLMDGVIVETYGGDIQIGDRCSVNPQTIIYGHGGTKIGDDVLIAGHCMIIPSNHNYNRIDKRINQQGAMSLGIVIENDVWIGHNCSILDNVKIEQGCIIGAGSVVNKNLLAKSVYAGVPVRKIKSR